VARLARHLDIGDHDDTGTERRKDGGEVGASALGADCGVAIVSNVNLTAIPVPKAGPERDDCFGNI
jgi:hypothetical protein